MFGRFTFKLSFLGFQDDTVIGSAGRDVLFGFWGNDTLDGLAGRDKLFGGFGNDILSGGLGHDKLFGGFGNDILNGGAGRDRLFGGWGDDTAVFDGSVEDYSVTQRGAQTRVTDATGETDRLWGIEQLYFAADDYTAFLDGRNSGVLARDDTATTTENEVVTIAGLTGNDFDFDGDTLSIVSIDDSATLGSATLNADGTIAFDPGTAFDGLKAGEIETTTLTYTVSDGRGATATASVVITVIGENDAPVLTVADAVTIDENTTAVTTAAAMDIDGDAISFSVTGDDALLFSIDASGALTFKAAPDFEKPTDINGDGIYDVFVTASDGTDTVAQAVAVTVADVVEGPPPEFFINEFHYDNAGSDVGEFIEVAVTKGADASDVVVTLYNGSNGSVYNTLSLPGAPAGGDDVFDYYVIDLPANGLQNGAPDGLALSNSAGLIEFLSYEGTMVAVGGAADGVTSTDIGVAETSGTAIGDSLQRINGAWVAPAANTKGDTNAIVDNSESFISEFHYDNDGSDVGEFIEVAVTAGSDASGLVVTLYNGSNGSVYNTLTLPEAPAGSDAAYDYYVIDLPSNGLQNGAPDGLALSDGDGLIEFLSYEGTMTAVGGPADGATSTDVGVAETSSTAIGDSLQLVDGVWAGPAVNTKGATNSTDDPVDPPVDALEITEFHYDNAGADVGEFIEVQGAPGGTLDGWSLVLYNGSGGASYRTIELTGTLNEAGVASFDTPGLQNGAPDGFALIRPDSTVAEFLSYEGTMTATDGPAVGLTSTDVGVSEPGTTAVGDSLQKIGGVWTGPAANTRDAANASDAVAFINEFHYDNAGSDVGEFIEVAVTKGGDASGLVVTLYNGSNGAPYGSPLTLGTAAGSDDDFDYYVIDLPSNGLQNGAPDGLALSDGDGLIEFLSYEGTMTAVGGPADGATSTDVGVAETSSTAIGDSLQLVDGVWTGPSASTKGATNGEVGPPPPPAAPKLISEVQGNGDASALVGQSVTVSAIVTQIVSNGFYLQEEDSDADADVATSEGIFVFTGDTPGVVVGDGVNVTGNVDEFFDATQIEDVSLIEVFSVANSLPTAAQLSLPDSISVLETYEGMRVSLAADPGDAPLTIIENFNFARFGELVVSEGVQIQPTQLFDPNAEAAEVAALTQANALNRIAIDDGVGGSNPTSFAYIANTSAGDDGDGILSAGDTFTAGGPTVRLGAEITGSIDGVLSFNFGEYKIIPSDTLNIDPATNAGAREETPPDVGGDLKVVSFNALNYFTTFGERGADNQDEFDRQEVKLVNALEALDADIIGLQEIENNGFGAESSIATLVEALNDRVGAGTYAFVDPTTDGGPVGTDAIATGLIYRVDAVTVIDSDTLIFDDGAQQRNRPATAAVFEDENGEQIVIAVNHFKSKGGTGDGLDADQGDGQGNFNAVRTNAAAELAAWLDVRFPQDPDKLVIGDLNAYSQEDPLTALKDAGYTDLLAEFVGVEDAFSFVFDGQQGALDHALYAGGMLDQITGVAEWHINSQEPGLLGYDTSFTDAGFFNPDDPFRASDHDPLILGLTLGLPNDLPLG